MKVDAMLWNLEQPGGPTAGLWAAPLPHPGRTLTGVPPACAATPRLDLGVVIDSGRSFKPSQTTMQASVKPRFLISVRTWSLLPEVEGSPVS